MKIVCCLKLQLSLALVVLAKNDAFLMVLCRLDIGRFSKGKYCLQETAICSRSEV